MSQHSPNLAAAAPADPEVENALLRASLARAEQRIAELEQLAGNDPLTGLPNARRFAAELERVTGLAERHSTPAALVSIDLSAACAAHGTLALLHVARLLSTLIRTTDFLARTGEERICLLLDHLDHNSAIETAERLARCIAASPAELAHSRVTLRPFIATTGIMPGDKPHEVLARAEGNLARAAAGD